MSHDSPQGSSISPKSLSELARGIFEPTPAWANQPITQIVSDSRKVVPGCVFVALPGSVSDGHDFVKGALEQGAVWTVGERPISGVSDRYSVVSSSAESLALLAHRFYGEPSRSLLVLGVTGTSGKTTTTYLLESILKSAGKKPGVIGTVNFRFLDRVFPSTHTTPGPIELQALLAQMRDAGCDAVVMEVSSHALKQKRTAHVAFDGMLFTNLTREHLDFHPDMEDYFRSKALLFTHYFDEARGCGKSPQAVVNVEGEFGSRLLNLNPKAKSFSVESSFESLRLTMDGILGTASGMTLKSKLLGSFNASNILGAALLAQSLGISHQAIEEGVSELQVVPGRLELVPQSIPKGFRVLVDYAHKPDALEKVLETLREIVPRGKGRILTVMGCGGDRDRSKRPVMGKISESLSDAVYVTSDNPRTEDPIAIINEILVGMSQKPKRVEPDRKKAIFAAIHEAQPGDLVLIAGKGHEDYQILGRKKIHFDDREVAAQALIS